MNEYYKYVNKHSHSSIATMCDPCFNYAIFEKLMPGSTQDRKKAKIKTGFKEYYWKNKTW
jgi:hypothetical protein